jgi:hypothetical protein
VSGTRPANHAPISRSCSGPEGGGLAERLLPRWAPFPLSLVSLILRDYTITQGWQTPGAGRQFRPLLERHLEADVGRREPKTLVEVVGVGARRVGRELHAVAPLRPGLARPLRAGAQRRCRPPGDRGARGPTRSPHTGRPGIDVEDEDPPSGVAVVGVAPAPGRSWATTTPMATVAPAAAAAIAPRVSARNRDVALSLPAGVLGSPAADIWWASSVGDRPHPNMLKSTPTQGPLWSCRDSLPDSPRVTALSRYDLPRPPSGEQTKGRRWPGSTRCEDRSKAGASDAPSCTSTSSC